MTTRINDKLNKVKETDKKNFNGLELKSLRGQWERERAVWNFDKRGQNCRHFNKSRLFSWKTCN